jgi:hypothetical protein
MHGPRWQTVSCKWPVILEILECRELTIERINKLTEIYYVNKKTFKPVLMEIVKCISTARAVKDSKVINLLAMIMACESDKDLRTFLSKRDEHMLRFYFGEMALNISDYTRHRALKTVYNSWGYTTWRHKLDAWCNGHEVLKYPADKNKPFIWRTSNITQSENTHFNEEFVDDSKLPQQQDFTAFKQYFDDPKNKKVVAFKSRSGTCFVVPIPQGNKNFATLKNFIDEADMGQQKALWKCVAHVTRKLLKKHQNIWISTHSHDVSYLHVIISENSMYYNRSNLSRIQK